MENLSQCQKCELCRTRKNVVFGRGGLYPRLLVLGEAPGATEDEEGLPFVGRSGRLLEELFSEVGISAKDIYITNVVKCRPPNNRRPNKNEVDSCRYFCEYQIDKLKPEVILLLGNTAYSAWVGKQNGITSIRGNWIDGNIMATVHPSYVLRFPNKRYMLLQDLEKVKERLYSKTLQDA